MEPNGRVVSTLYGGILDLTAIIACEGDHELLNSMVYLNIALLTGHNSFVFVLIFQNCIVCCIQSVDKNRA